MTKLTNAFEQFGSAASGGKIIMNQYGYDDKFVYEKIGRTVLKASITAEENSQLRHMSHNDYVGPQSIFKAAFKRENRVEDGFDY